MYLVRVFVIFLVCRLASAHEANPVVRVAHGLIQGTWQVSHGGKNYASFQGIPYARPPVGKYRFREPQQLKPWPGVWDARSEPPSCIQYDAMTDSIEGSENCLFVNVYTPSLNAGARLPVFVYIHGGAFMFGYGTFYSPKRVIDKDFVVVTLNYRLGPLGFLSTGDVEAPGNFGLKDQAFALQWVQSNIMMFGGDPDSVTLAGCSAGGASVHHHYLSPLSKGTFHRGIAISGSAFASWAISLRPAQKAKALAAIVGCPTARSKEMVDCLKYRPAETLVKAQIEMIDWKIKLFGPFVPSIESPQVRGAFMTEHPYHASQAGAMQRLPLLTSVTAEEGLYPAAAYMQSPDTLPELEASWHHLASTIFFYNDTLPLDQHAVVADKIKQRYLGGKPVSKATFSLLVQALSDRLFVEGVGQLAQIHALKSKQPTFVYRYTYRGDVSLSNHLTHDMENYGVSHADDAFHIFDLIPDTPAGSKMADTLIDMIYNFATTGAPKVSNGSEWKQVTPGSPSLDYLEMSGPTSFQMKSSSDFGHKSFWDSLGFLENERYHNSNFRDEL